MSKHFKRFWIQLTANRRRFHALLLMLAVGTVIWAKPVGLLLWSRVRLLTNIPCTALAEDEANALSGTSVQRPIQPLPQAKTVTLDERTERDPFQISGTHFPKPTPDPESTKVAGKSQSNLAEGSVQPEVNRQQQLREVIAGLELEAVMQGAELVVISGENYRKGDQIAAPEASGTMFRLAEVGQRSVTLRYEEYEFQLRMASPLSDYNQSE